MLEIQIMSAWDEEVWLKKETARTFIQYLSLLHTCTETSFFLQTS